MIQFPSDRPDHDKQHVCGSQKAADETIARNAKRAAKSSTKQHRGISVVLTGAVLEIVVFVCMATFLLSIVIVFFTRHP